MSVYKDSSRLKDGKQSKIQFKIHSNNSSKIICEKVT